MEQTEVKQLKLHPCTTVCLSKDIFLFKFLLLECLSLFFCQSWREYWECIRTKQENYKLQELYLNSFVSFVAEIWLVTQEKQKAVFCSARVQRRYSHGTVKTGGTQEAFICNFEAASDSICYFHRAVALRAACIWFHREVVNMPVFSTSPLFRHAQLRRSGSKVSARGCGHCRSAFTHTNLHLSGFSPQYGWMLLPVSPCWARIKHWRAVWAGE